MKNSIFFNFIFFFAVLFGASLVNKLMGGDWINFDLSNVLIGLAIVGTLSKS